MGPLAGLTYHKMPAEFAEPFQRYLSGDPDVFFSKITDEGNIISESLRQVQERMVHTMGNIIKQHKGKRIFVFTHGIAIKMWIAAMVGWTISQGFLTLSLENTSISILEIPFIETQKSPITSVKLHTVNDHAHLQLTDSLK